MQTIICICTKNLSCLDRWEAAQIPKVKVAKLNLSKVSNEQTPYMPKIPEITKCPLNLLPSKDWEDVFLANFSELRQVNILSITLYC